MSYKGMEAILPVKVIDIESVATNIEGIHSEKPGNSLATTIYPNPTNSEFTLLIDMEEDEKASVSIYNMQGRKIEERSIESKKSTFNIGKYPQGLYFVRVVTDKGKSSSQKVIKK
jgi:hypothetical protein